MIYLDNSATTRPYDRVIAEMGRVDQTVFGNPSAVHGLGVAAEAELRRGRQSVARALGCPAERLFFTSGGTESNNLAILGAVQALRRRGNRIVTTDSEHPSVLEPMKALAAAGFDVVYLKTRGGKIDEEALFEAVTPQTILVSIMAVNNETGAVYPVSLGKQAILRAKAPALLHTDCVQAFCKIPFSPESLQADLISVSSHKIHGPKGCGGLYLRAGARIVPPYLGGGQEKNLRSGTENVAGIVGFGTAAEIFWGQKEAQFAKLAALRTALLRELEAVPRARVLEPWACAPQIVSVSLQGVRSEVIVRYLEGRGIYVSAGSACASHKKGARSQALTAFGLASAIIDTTVRLSFTAENREEDMAAVAAALDACGKELGGSLS